MKKYILLLLIPLIFSSCQNKDSIDNQKPTVVTTIYPLEYIIDTIGGDYINLKSVYSNNVDIHDFELSTKEIQQILDADYYIGVDEKEEPFLSTLKQSVKNKESDLKIFEITKSDKLKDTFSKEDYINDENLKNYHFFTSPKKALTISEVIYDYFIKEDSLRENEYYENFLSLKEKLIKINEMYEKLNVNKKYYVTHSAYYWLQNDYDIQIEGIKGDDHHYEPSQKEIQNIIDYMNENNIKTIYTETTDKENELIKSIAKQTNAQIKYLNNFESKEEDYLTGLEKNYEALKEND